MNHAAPSFRDAAMALRSSSGALPAATSLIRYAPTATDDDIAHLADILAASGHVTDTRHGTCDIASTGGPTSLSTLLCPLMLRACGHVVPKVSVPGRPAGAIDVLGTIPGFRTQLTHLQFQAILDKTGFCHILAQNDIAPLDGLLFSLRKRLNAVDVVPLAIASLLAKKLAVGLQTVLLDVRVWDSGNFGHCYDAARQNAIRFCRVAKILGIRAKCVLTDASRPYQPFLGRGESLLALDQILYGAPDQWLQGHADDCFRMARLTIASPMPHPHPVVLRTIFQSLLTAQHSSYTRFRARINNLLSMPTAILHSPAPGYLAINLQHARHVLVANQLVDQHTTRFPDPIGIRILAAPDSRIPPGTPIVAVRHAAIQNPEAMLQALRPAFSILPEPPLPLLPMEIVS